MRESRFGIAFPQILKYSCTKSSNFVTKTFSCSLHVSFHVTNSSLCTYKDSVHAHDEP